MKQALVTLARAFGQVLNAYNAEFDEPTARLMNALIEWIKANE